MFKMSINKNIIERVKNKPEAFDSFVKNRNESDIIHLLNRIGRLESDFDKKSLLSLLKNSNENIRALSLKNLAKLSDVYLLSTFLSIAKEDKNSLVRREAVSAIGRLRNSKAVPFLVELLNDSDPKVAMQAIRGLLVFKGDSKIKESLKNMLNHPNELIREIINKEVNGLKYKSKDKLKHTQSQDFMKNVVVHADVIEALQHIPDESIHLTFTSPPYYNARDYSIYQSYKDYLEFLEKVFKEVYRVTKEGRFFILNTSPIIIPRVSRQHSSKRYPIPFDIHPLIIKMGWEFIDDIVWVKPEASVKNRNAGFLQHRKPLAYKPNSVTEMVMVYRKKTHKLIDWNIREYDWGIVKRSKVKDDYETTNVWRIDPTFDKVHKAVFPIELCERVIKFYSYVGDLVFDPFAGSGTFGKAAIKNNRYFFLTEDKERHVKRIKEEVEQEVLFADRKPRVFNLNQFKELTNDGKE